MSATLRLPAFADVLAAAKRIDGHVHHTPVMTSATIDRMAGRHVFFKCENFQKTGSFKVRGAVSAVNRLTHDEAQRGVVAASTGNYAQALAWAARRRGIPAHVVVPRAIPAIKLEGIVDYGAHITFCDGTAQLSATAARLARESGGRLLASSENPDAIAGQGTAALELLDDAPHVKAVVCPVGSGGLLAGSCLAAAGRGRPVAVFGVEPASADDAARSFFSGRLTAMTPGASSIADGLLVSLAEPSWLVIKERAAGVLTVDEHDIGLALRLVWERMKLVIEPSAAVSLAAVLSAPFREILPGEAVAVILTGGNSALQQEAVYR